MSAAHEDGGGLLRLRRHAGESTTAYRARQQRALYARDRRREKKRALDALHAELAQLRTAAPDDDDDGAYTGSGAAAGAGTAGGGSSLWQLLPGADQAELAHLRAEVEQLRRHLQALHAQLDMLNQAYAAAGAVMAAADAGMAVDAVVVPCRAPADAE